MAFPCWVLCVLNTGKQVWFPARIIVRTRNGQLCRWLRRGEELIKKNPKDEEEEEEEQEGL